MEKEEDQDLKVAAIRDDEERKKSSAVSMFTLPKFPEHEFQSWTRLQLQMFNLEVQNFVCANHENEKFLPLGQWQLLMNVVDLRSGLESLQKVGLVETWRL